MALANTAYCDHPDQAKDWYGDDSLQRLCRRVADYDLFLEERRRKERIRRIACTLFASKAVAVMPQVQHIADESLSLEQRFLELAEKWEQDTAFVSSTTKRVMHPSYQSIIGMGREVVPMLLRDLQRNRRVWFWALNHITGANPVKPEDAGNIDKMTKAWLDWGKGHGLI